MNCVAKSPGIDRPGMVCNCRLIVLVPNLKTWHLSGEYTNNTYGAKSHSENVDYKLQ